MTRFWREGHHRTGALGDTHWVEGHWVERFDWEHSANGSVPDQPRTHHRLAFSTYESFTIPNARCPFCPARVFFYQSPYGGKVYFDRLGVPWPKHPCMDTGRQRSPEQLVRSPLIQGSQSSETVGVAAVNTPSWEDDGWVPIRIAKIAVEDEWYVIKCYRVEDDTFVRLLIKDYTRELVNSPAMVSQVDEHGFSVISYLDVDGEPSEVPVYDYGRYYSMEPWRAESYRKILLTK